jgi:hypothetical protein
MNGRWQWEQTCWLISGKVSAMKLSDREKAIRSVRKAYKREAGPVAHSMNCFIVWEALKADLGKTGINTERGVNEVWTKKRSLFGIT